MGTSYDGGNTGTRESNSALMMISDPSFLGFFTRSARARELPDIAGETGVQLADRDNPTVIGLAAR